VHPSAEHSYLYFFFWATFLGVGSSSVDDSRFLFEAFVMCAAFTAGLLRAVTELTRDEVARRRVEEETSADEFFFFFLALFAASTAAAASAFLSWLSL
jgi:hypothetical protein